MKELTKKHLFIDELMGTHFIFIHSPFCGTCHLARKMLETVEAINEGNEFFEMNASLFPEFMQENKIRSVPCLLIIKNGEINQKVYSFQSVTNIYNFIVNS